MKKHDDMVDATRYFFTAMQDRKKTWWRKFVDRFKKTGIYNVLRGDSVADVLFNIGQWLLIGWAFARMLYSFFVIDQYDAGFAYAFATFWIVLGFMNKGLLENSNRQRDDVLEIAKQQQFQIEVMKQLLEAKGFHDFTMEPIKKSEKKGEAKN